MEGQKQKQTVWQLIKEALSGQELNLTQGSIRRAIFVLSVPMILEMMMESLFAVVDIYFVSRLGSHATAAVGLTESVIFIIYALAIGLSMAGTSIIARRIGEEKPGEANKAGFQLIVLGLGLAIITGVLGFIFAKDVLTLMGGEGKVVSEGFRYTRILYAGNYAIFMLFLINAIFRGAGNALIAMKVLWLANGINIILDPILIHGFGPIPAMGLEGAAIATVTGRSIGVVFQLYILLKGSALVKLTREAIVLQWKTIGTILKVSAGGTGQHLIEVLAWIFLVRIVARFGQEAVAGYTIAIRMVMFTILPAFGMAQAAATLVGQNLGAKEPGRAEQSVWITARYAAIFMVLVSTSFLFGGEWLVSFFDATPAVVSYGGEALSIIGLGYLAFAYGLVLSMSFNGAGDTSTPVVVNLICFWALQTPLAWLLAVEMGWGVRGVFITIAVCHSIHAVISGVLFRRGKWKLVQV